MTKKITALKIQKKNPQRINVYVDGDFAFGVSRMVGAWLEVGQTLSEAKVEELRAEDERETAYQKALRYISQRPRSEHEVVDSLRKRGIAEDTIESVIERLKEHEHIGDTSFAKLWVENRSEYRPRGRIALLAELRQKRVSGQIIEEALEGLDEARLAMEAARKQARRYQGLPWIEYRKKLYGFLSRRGFPYEIISQIIPHTWEELQKSNSEGKTQVKEVAQ